MKKTYLNGIWQMSGEGYAVSGNIPGSVYSFLHVDNQILPDPYFRDNEDIYTALGEKEFTFERSFDHKSTKNRVFLVFEGLDTLCSVYLNGRLVAETDNMHLKYSFDVSDFLRDGENDVSVVCHPVVKYMREKNEKNRLFGATDCMVGYPYVRKAHSMMGWDWGPRLPDAGIWRSVYLLEKDSAELIDVEILQRHSEGKVFLTPKIECDGGEIQIKMLSPDGDEAFLAANVENEIENPKLWWPNGLGGQNLYEIQVDLLENGKTVDAKCLKIGLRELKLIRRKDQYGESFYHEINGVDMFAMGADYIPEDNIFSRITPERSRELLTHCKNANFNAIRVWGGGYYPDDFFFEICDELGLVVFFDLMFACSVYDFDERELESISLEVEQNLRRIRHHACIGLVCGNNEIEWHFHDYVSISGRSDREHLTDTYLEIFEKRFPKIVERVAPYIPYIPSSPTSGGGFSDPNGEKSGDCHDWDSDFISARNRLQRYVSEFGFQSLPDLKTVESFTLPEDRNLNSYILEKHQRSFGGNELITTQMIKLYRFPTSFEEMIYLSQLSQAESVKYRVEHLRRHRERCCGALYWQLNDIWPVISWSSIDYYGRFKALQYAAKRFFSPILISCEETGELQNRRYVNIEEGQYNKDLSARLCVTNDTLRKVTGIVRWQIRDSESNIIREGQDEICLSRISAYLPEIDLSGVDPHKHHLAFSFETDGETVSFGSTLFCAPKHYEFVDPQLKWRAEGDEIVITSRAYAKAVHIYSECGDILLDDNFFDMEVGEKRVKIISGRPEKIKLRTLYGEN